MTRGNLGTGLRRRRGPGSPALAMAAHDRLPRAAREWAAGAALPWSAQSIARLWHRAVQQGGPQQGEAAARAALDAAEQRRLAADSAAGPG